jgi:hypothetical protein
MVKILCRIQAPGGWQCGHHTPDSCDCGLVPPVHADHWLVARARPGSRPGMGVGSGLSLGPIGDSAAPAEAALPAGTIPPTVRPNRASDPGPVGNRSPSRSDSESVHAVTVFRRGFQVPSPLARGEQSMTHQVTPGAQLLLSSLVVLVEPF